MSFDSILEKRHCVRHFKTTKKVNFNDIAKIIDSAKYAPCAGGIFSMKFLVIDDNKLFPKIADACLGQSFIANASHLIIVCSDMSQIERSYGKKANFFARQQAGAAIENMFLKATDLGLATCWIGTFDENVLKRITDIPDNFIIEAVLPIGYEMGKEKQREKMNLKFLIRYNKWKTKYVAGETSKASDNI